MSIFMEYVQKNAAAKNKTAAQWLLDTAENAKHCAWATHIGRFSHPSADVSLQVLPAGKKADGYVYTTNVDCDPDMAVGANYLATPKLLMLELEDKKTVFDHLLQDMADIRTDICSLSVEYGEVREKLLQIPSNQTAQASDERIKQVYFPVTDGQYHILSVLASSSLLMEAKKRLQAMTTKAIRSRDKKSDVYGQSCEQIYGITEMGYGSTKPQNISFANNGEGGRVYMIDSLPPKLFFREVIRPRRNFFTNTLRLREFWTAFQWLHGLMIDKRKNMEIRKKRDEIVDYMVDQVLLRACQLSELEAGWSNADTYQLPMAQKIWLDTYYAKARNDAGDWREEIAKDFARWLAWVYKKIFKEKASPLGDAELLFFAEQMKKAILANGGE